MSRTIGTPVCFNNEEAAKDRHDREALFAKLEEKLKTGGVGGLINKRAISGS